MTDFPTGTFDLPTAATDNSATPATAFGGTINLGTGLNRLITNIIAFCNKIGNGSSTPIANSVLAGNGTGTSAWSTVPTLAGTVTAGGFSTTGAVNGATVTATGALAGGSASISGNGAIVPAPVSGTPAQHGLYRESVVKGWIKVTVSAGTPSIAGSYNVTSITDAGVGLLTITWDRDFASTNYAVVGDVYDSAVGVHQIGNAPAAGSNGMVASNLSGTQVDPIGYMAIAIGPQ